MKNWLSIAFIIILHSLSYSQEVRINEVVSSSTQPFIDGVSGSPDFIELYNFGNFPVDLAGWSISDEPYGKDKFIFPDTLLLPDAYMIVIADGDDSNEEQFLKADFGVKSTGEFLYLKNELNQVHTALELPCIPRNRSYGYTASGELNYFYVPSAGSENIEELAYQLPEIELTLSHQAGFYNDAISLDVSHPLGDPIYYTLDGTIPNENSSIYTNAISLTERSDAEGLAYISTADTWQEPEEAPLKGYNLKFTTLSEGCSTSGIIAADYFISSGIEEKYPYHKVSLSFNESDLFGSKGIYVPGETGENYSQKGEEWERSAHLQLFTPANEMVLNQEVDLRIKGRGSRRNSQKSFRVYARTVDNSNAFNYNLLKDRDFNSYRRFALRSGHSDFTQTLIKDLIAAELVEGLNVDYMESQTASVFLNGTYWGIQNIRENIDKYYLNQHYGVHPDSVTIVKFQVNQLIANEGTTNDFRQLIIYADDHDLAITEHYQEVLSRIDVDNFIDYQITELYLANWDWSLNNQKVWKENSEGIYRWLFYDCDGCLYIYSLDKLSDLADKDLIEAPSISLLKNLLENLEFRKKFKHRYLSLMHSHFSPEKIIQKVDSLELHLEPLISDHMNRWHVPSSYSSWQDNLSEMRVFALQRPTYVMHQLEQFFDLEAEIHPNPIRDEFTIDFGEEGSEVDIQIFDVSGRLIKQRLGITGETIPLEGLKDGLYIFKLRVGLFQTSKKVQVSH